MQNVHLRTLITLDRALDTVLQGEGAFKTINDAYRDLSIKTTNFTKQFQSRGKRSNNTIHGSEGLEEFERTNQPVIMHGFFDSFIAGMSEEDALRFLSTVKSLTITYLTTGTLSTATVSQSLSGEVHSFTQHVELTNAITTECDTFFTSLALPSYGFEIELLRTDVDKRFKSSYGLNISSWKNIHPKFWALADAQG